jgi:hypothetical protein
MQAGEAGAQRAEGERSSRMDRGAVWKKLGAPRDQVGSVNDPRTYETCGVKWNEKWIYPRSDGTQRVVLWNRYDLLGAFVVAADGSFEPDPVLGN